jgi:hypothetical protein
MDDNYQRLAVQSLPDLLGGNGKYTKAFKSGDPAETVNS